MGKLLQFPELFRDRLTPTEKSAMSRVDKFLDEIWGDLDICSDDGFDTAMFRLLKVTVKV